MLVLTTLKDALLCLLIVNTLAGMRSKNAYASVGFIVLLLCMGLDL